MSETVQTPLPNGVLCPGCGYDLGGLMAGGACPECGRVSEPGALHRQVESRVWIALAEVRGRRTLIGVMILAVVVLVLSIAMGGVSGGIVMLTLLAVIGAANIVGMHGAWLIRRAHRRLHRAIWMNSLWVLLLPYGLMIVSAGLGAATGGLDGLFAGLLVGITLSGLASPFTLLAFLGAIDMDMERMLDSGQISTTGGLASIACACVIGLLPLGLGTCICAGQTMS